MHCSSFAPSAWGSGHANAKVGNEEPTVRLQESFGMTRCSCANAADQEAVCDKRRGLGACPNALGDGRGPEACG